MVEFAHGIGGTHSSVVDSCVVVLYVDGSCDGGGVLMSPNVTNGDNDDGSCDGGGVFMSPNVGLDNIETVVGLYVGL